MNRTCRVPRRGHVALADQGYTYENNAYDCTGLQVYMAVQLWGLFFWVTALLWCGGFQRFGGIYCLHRVGKNLKMAFVTATIFTFFSGSYKYYKYNLYICIILTCNLSY
jgi:hypothetical protein